MPLSLPLPPPLPLPRPPLRRLLRLGSLLLVFLTATAGATVPLDVAVHRTALARLLLDYNGDGVPDRKLAWAVQPQRILAADMNRDGLDDLVTYRAGVWGIDYDLDGVAESVTSFGGTPGDTPLLGDFDGDGDIDFAIFRSGEWFVRYRAAGIPDGRFSFGAPGDVALAADVDGNGVADRILYRAGQWLVDFDGDGLVDDIAGLGGDPADRPFAVDWNGDGGADFGVFRNGHWFVLTRPFTVAARVVVHGYGAAGDLPLAGRFDRALTSAKFQESSSRVALFRRAEEASDSAFFLRMLRADDADLYLRPGADGTPLAADVDGTGRSALLLYADGIWQVDRNLDGVTDEIYAFGGVQGDVPLVADVDGDGHADLAIYRGGAWYISTGRDGQASIFRVFGGAPGDIPVLGDINGDGHADLGVYRLGWWYFDLDGDSQVDRIYLFGGAPGDVPLLADWNGDHRADLVIFRAGDWFVSTEPATSQAAMHFGFGAAGDVPVIGRFVLQTSAAPVLFAARGVALPRIRYPGMLPPAVADFDGDGLSEPLGGRTTPSGTVLGVDLGASGLAALGHPDRVNRDCRAADVDGDGYVDVVCNSYQSVAESEGVARLFRGNGDGTFEEDAAFAALNLRGYGETIAVADFDNDGDIDIFIPYYSHNDPAERSYLLRNDGSGHFVDVASTAGVALQGVPAEHRVEGSQALDYDDDGRIDLYVAGRLFRNTGSLLFTDMTAQVGLPGGFDEGIRFLDWNNDGRLDLVIHHPVAGPALWQYDGAQFHRRDNMPTYLNADIYGMNVADLNGDGREDLIVAGGLYTTPHILLNTGDRFERNPVSLVENINFGPVVAHDFDGDGRLDLMLSASPRPPLVARNISPDVNRATIVVEVVDDAGRRNQFGRVVRVTPSAASGTTMTRVVDGGSGMLAQGAYPLTVHTPWAGNHRVEVRYATGVVAFDAAPGARLRVFPDGHVEAF
jgi:hypothetical protein